MTCCNNPQSIQQLQEETILVMVVLGPDEPTLEEMNKLIDIWVQYMLRLGQGVHTYLLVIATNVFGRNEV